MARFLAIAVLVLGCASRSNSSAMSNPAPDAGSGPGPQPETPPGSTLLEPDASSIQSVSPDGKRVLISPRGEQHQQGLALVTRGGPTQFLVNGGTAYGSFLSDGRSLVFQVGDTGTATGPSLFLARVDGSGVRRLAARHSFSLQAGRWLYYTDETDSGFALYRLEPPDGAPQSIATYSGAYDPYGAIWATVSPGEESIAFCIESPALDCYLLPHGSDTASKLPGRFYWLWAPDGSWLLLQPCHLVDMSGNVRKLCDATAPFGPVALSPDGSLLATLVGTSTGIDVHLIATSTGAEVVLPRPGPVDENAFRPRHEIGFTPDGSRLITIIAHASFSIPVAGVSWTLITSDHGARGMSESDWLTVSPDSRIIADYSAALDGVVESIDGAAPQQISQGAFTTMLPLFEPAGGLGKAIFFSHEDAWLAKADGSGLGLVVAHGSPECEWHGRTAICFSGHQDSHSIWSRDVIGVTDEGTQKVTLARNTTSYAVQGASLFYVPSSGGLYAVDGLPAP